MSSVLVVDDSPSSIRIVRGALENMEVDLLAAGSAAEALDLIAHRHPDVVVLDIALPDQSGLAIFEHIRGLDPRLPVIFITASGTSHTAIEAMKQGAFDYLVKPLDVSQVRQLVEQALTIRRFMHVPVRMNDLDGQDPDGPDLIIGRCKAMQEVYKAIGRIAQQDIAVLIRGESGTGKELVARAIYQYSPRAKGPFLAVNCAAIPEGLLESELFGHEKGAFTGANVRKVGKFEQCNGGTLFLDEVGDMTPLMQSKVLRALQDKRFERVGGNETIESDVWIVAATNRHLETMIAAGQFRADLYYRLNGYPITLPPLRERGSDIPLLVVHFLRRYASDFGKAVRDVSPEAMDLLVRHAWPGNVRELQSTLRQSMLQATGPILLPEFLPAELQRPSGQASAAQAVTDSPMSVLVGFIQEQIRGGTMSLYADSVAHLERILLEQVLHHSAGNQSQAAEILGITRGTLRNKIREHGIRITQSISVENEQDEAESPSCASQS